MTSQVSIRRFLISGCQRSGTTALAMALEAHPHLRVVEENDRRYHRKGARTLEFDETEAQRDAPKPSEIVGYKVPRDSHRLTDISVALPGVRVLWIEREMYQTVASMIALGRAERNWATEFAPLEIAKHIDAWNDSVAVRLLERLWSLTVVRDRAIGLATLCWLVKSAQKNAYLQSLGDRIDCIDYGKLVLDPRNCLETVLRGLETTWSNRVLHHSQFVDDRERPGGADPGRSLDNASLGKWKKALAPYDCAFIDKLATAYRTDGRLDLSA